MTKQNKSHISWDEFFMGVAMLSAKRSKDPNTQVGACIVNKDKIIMGTGYNGATRGFEDSKFPWSREGPFLKTKYPFVCHAELNAILNSHKNVSGCSIFVALFPCNECAKAIAQSGIKEVVYLSNKYEKTDSVKASNIIFKQAKIKTRQLNAKTKDLKLSFKVE